MKPRSPRTGRRVLSTAPDRAGVVVHDPNVVRPATREETFPIALGAVVLSFLALIICYSHGYLLLYGDAVAHLGIARKILDSRNPGLAQLGGVWLPLPHLLIVPFVQKMIWWQNGLAGAWPSLLCYVAGVAGFYRLARLMLVPRWAIAATAFYALNPNLLYLATTAMTEPLFLALLIWMTLLTAECCAAIRAGRHGFVARRLMWLGLLIVAAVFTRYDGWIAGAVVWCVVAWTLARHRAVWAKVRPAFVLMTVLAVAAPLSWLWYNQHFYHDPLDFMRGPYSAAAIEKKTSPPGAKHYRGWHNPAWALLFYTRTAQVDAVAWEVGFAVMVAALVGLWSVIRRQLQMPVLLLWMPLPFYVYSVAYGSVPIFIPQLYPHSFYNARYGMEMLPALALFCFVAIAMLEERIRGSKPLAARLMEPVVLALIAANTIAMIYFVPLVLKEGIVNATTRVPFEAAIARELEKMQGGVPILMSTSDHVGAVQQAGIPLRQMLSDADWDTWHPALEDPAGHAAFVVAIAGDPVSAAVAAHPAHLTELTVLCSTGQPCARIYQSDIYKGASTGSIR
ncbi:ArnT family glycosyltransferase [Granulicella arctica]|uniref:ArnT family glycosyltransferase n=1 Tax=Granulicella arctica TaxID=940613 RepID=UPI0021E05EE0|nr:hypothetical protein [Granulicella arctica]